ncbi:DUF1801 domain-containing protein [Flavihumibacter sp. RY-1]|uniref:DUF1801 domain-containing protein n=1 Tax=Flavihumibacter fluminis TaxID=2909236 RepID=A0ABS9BDW8_9BACT|nr:DUF1801 domain-containing protein [Flavihumibacter fluminis]MCF1713500.1 DUF1801 domain-containing protein [Flavihumibacter fluminis]
MVSSTAPTVSDYLRELPEEKRAVMQSLRSIVQKNIPTGFQECMQYGMISYVVPHSLYPSGYHCDPRQPLPFLSLAAQKNHFAVYHMGMYADPQLLSWFQEAFAAHYPYKLDMGKSCMRFKKPEQVPVELIGELAAKMSPKDWISLYEGQLKKKK